MILTLRLCVQAVVGSSVAAIIGLSNNDWIQVQSGDIRRSLSTFNFEQAISGS